MHSIKSVLSKHKIGDNKVKTSEQILNEIQNAMALNKNNVEKCNVALSDAVGLILHNEKEMQKRLDEEYKRGINDAWEVAREIHVDYDEFTEIFGEEPTIGYIIQNSNPLEVKEKIELYREEKENKLNMIHVGDIVQDKNDNIKATILDFDHDTNLVGVGYWMVFTENGCVESWCENNFTKTGEAVDVCGVLIK